MSHTHTYHQYNPEKDMDKRFIGFTIATALGLTAATGVGTAVGLTGVGLAVGAGITGGLAFGASKLLPKAPEPAKLPSLPAPPVLNAPGTAESATAKAKAETTDKRRSIARNKTVYTSPVGLTPLDKSGLNLKTLTGA